MRRLRRVLVALNLYATQLGWLGTATVLAGFPPRPRIGWWPRP